MVNRNASLAMLGLAALLFSACSGGGGLLGPTTPSSVSVDSVEFASFSLVNDERKATKSGSKLAKESAVARLAREYSEEMKREGFFSHTTPDGRGLETRLREAGIECPKDISIVGFDDISFVPHLSPPLTTMRQPREEIGRMATDAVIDIIEGSEKGAAPLHVALSAELVVRGSTAPYRD